MYLNTLRFQNFLFLGSGQVYVQSLFPFRHYIELKALHEIARVLAGSGFLKDQLSTVLDVLSRYLGMERGMISILDLNTGKVWIDIAHGVDVASGEVVYQPGEGITGKVAQTGRPMAISDLGDDALFLDRTGARKKLNREELTFLCVPVFFHEHVVGVLSTDKMSREVQDLDQELQLLSAVAELIGPVVHFRSVEDENLRLKKRLAEAKRPKTRIIGRSKGMNEVLRLVDQVADTNSTSTALISSGSKDPESRGGKTIPVIQDI